MLHEPSAPSAKRTVAAYTLNGNTGEFTVDYEPTASDSLPKLISPIQILCVRRQFVVENLDVSFAPGRSRANGIYKSPYVESWSAERCSFYNHKGEKYATPAGNDAFSESEITKICRESTISKMLRLNKKIVIFGMLNSKIVKISSSEGNVEEVLRFFASSTSNRIDPFVDVSSVPRKLGNGKEYFALKLSLSSARKLHPSRQEIATALSEIDDHVRSYNANLSFSSAPSLEVLQEFEERMRSYVAKTREIVRVRTPVRIGPVSKTDFVDPPDLVLVCTEDWFDFVPPSR